MASEQSVHPLRISKTNPASALPAMASARPRALTEIPPTEKRRNSPSWNQTTKKMALNSDSSPFQSSPLDGTTSPRLFWKNRNLNSENNNLYGGRNGSPSPTRRSSIERLQKASRVKNSNILALEHKQEYDPTRLPQVERPLAKVQGNAYGGTGMSGLRSGMGFRGHGHTRSESTNSIPLYSPGLYSPTKTPTKSSFSQAAPAPTLNRPNTPSKDQASPIKSSLSTSRFKSSYDQDHSGDISLEERELPHGKYLHRHAKSVTFDAAPPQVNEYEMATPDLSSIGTNSREGSFESEEDDDDDDEYGDHYGIGEPLGHDDSFDASLEDTAKTPVVGPDDWRQESPTVTRTGRLEDPFESSPMPEAMPTAAANARPEQQHARTDSTNSNGEHRPLPPLPGAGDGLPRLQSSSPAGLSTTAERMLGTQRSLPSPPPASASKAEIQNIGNGRMPLEERLRLMMLSDGGKTAAEQQRERRMRRAGTRGSATPERDVHNTSMQSEEEDTVGDLSGLGEYQLPPRISRESILRRVNGNPQTPERESEYRFSSPVAGSSPGRPLPLDPDEPIPSTEDSMLEDSMLEGGESSVIIHRDEEDVESDIDIDLSDIPDNFGHADSREREESEAAEDEFDGDQDVKASDDTESQYSDEPASVSSAATAKNDASPIEEEVSTTPRGTTPAEEPEPLLLKRNTGAGQSGLLPPVADGTRTIDFSNGLQEFMLPKPTEAAAALPKMADAPAYMQRPSTPPKPLSKPEYDGSGWGDDDEFEEPRTPDSVIHHPMSDDMDDSEPEEPDSPRAAVSPDIPEHVATIKASGSKLKTRPSATPSDLAAMRDARRQVSREIPGVPAIPDKHRNRTSRDMGDVGAELSMSESEAFLERHPSFKERSLTLDLDLGLSLDQDFERVIESQKRGYLMRQNTKVVSATDRQREDPRGLARSAGNSPVKQDRPQSWTVEPWNGQTRRKSVRSKRPGTGVASGPAPPLPGQESNVAASTNPIVEEELGVEMASEDSGERGRLFVKVMGVKDLDLPLPKNERTWFSLTLDNGVHCVTTAWLELARNAPIGQEFELVVPNDLEFQLTLNVKLERPAPQLLQQSSRAAQSSSPTKLSRPKASTFSRVFASPKKRKEMELRHKEEEERLAREQREAQQAQARLMLSRQQPSAWDLLSPLAAEDGSFARSYVCLKEHEARCFGRPYLVDVAAFNEWATEEPAFASSVKSKRGVPPTGPQVVRRAPYKIGKLELQLLFVPRPKGSSDDDMPKSMNSCIREMRAAEERLARNWEGHLSQQGGDCPYWRRRYFKLVGTKLTAYHEATRQPRATINLANAKRLIDDRRALTEKETTGKGGKRRRSAFAEEEEGYMFVEEGFRIRFNNGELIDFYADTAQEKEGWMKVLSDVVGRDSLGGADDAASVASASSRAKGKWCELVLKKEDALRRRAEGRRVHSRTKSMYP